MEANANESARLEETSPGKQTGKTLFIALGFLIVLGLLVALNMK